MHTASPYIIGIGGFRRSGKDTLARAIAQSARERGFAVTTIAFADPMRQAAAAAYGVAVEDFTDDKLKDIVHPEWGISRRQMLINLGEAMRNVNQDHWVKAWQRAVRKIDGEHVVSRASPFRFPVLILTPDLRRPNEAAAIHAAGGFNVLIRRRGIQWDGHSNEAMAEAAQDSRLLGLCEQSPLAQLPGLSYARDASTSLSQNGCCVYDLIVDNPVAEGAQPTDASDEGMHKLALRIMNHLHTQIQLNGK